MKINWKVRLRSFQFWIQVFLAIFGPILAYAGLSYEEAFNTWSSFGETVKHAISSPYVIGLVIISLYTAIVNTTSEGIGDDRQTLQKQSPKEGK